MNQDLLERSQIEASCSARTLEMGFLIGLWGVGRIGGHGLIQLGRFFHSEVRERYIPPGFVRHHGQHGGKERGKNVPIRTFLFNLLITVCSGEIIDEEELGYTPFLMGTVGTRGKK